MAPLAVDPLVVPDALGEAPDLEAVEPAFAELDAVVFAPEPVAVAELLAAAWKASKLFAAVGLMANTIPLAQ